MTITEHLRQIIDRRRIESGRPMLAEGEAPLNHEVYNAWAQLSSENGEEMRSYRARHGRRMSLFVINETFQPRTADEAALN